MAVDACTTQTMVSSTTLLGAILSSSLLAAVLTGAIQYVLYRSQRVERYNLQILPEKLKDYQEIFKRVVHIQNRLFTIKSAGGTINADTGRAAYDLIGDLMESIYAHSFFMTYANRCELMRSFVECENHINEQRKHPGLTDYKFVLKDANAICTLVEKMLKEDLVKSELVQSKGLLKSYIPNWKLSKHG